MLKKIFNFRASYFDISVAEPLHQMQLLDRLEMAVEPNTSKVAFGCGTLVAKDLRSDLLLVAHAEVPKFGMMLRTGDQPGQVKFAASSVRLLLSELSSLGIEKPELGIYAIGGVSEQSPCLSGLRDLLSAENISLKAIDVGLDQNRSAWLSLDSGRLIVRGSKASVPTSCSQLRSAHKLAS